MEKFLQKLIEGMEYYAKSYTISGNHNLSSSKTFRAGSKEENEINNIQTLYVPQHK